MPVAIRLHPKFKTPKCLASCKSNQNADVWYNFDLCNSNWLPAFAELLSAHLIKRSDGYRIDHRTILTRLREHKGSQYVEKELLFKQLMQIYALMSEKIQDKSLNFNIEDNTLYAEKLVEGIIACTAGLHSRVVFMWNCWKIEQNFSERLETIRRDIIESAAKTVLRQEFGQKDVDVHKLNDIMKAAQSRFGFNYANPSDPYKAGFTRNEMNNKIDELTRQFNQNFTPILVIKAIREQLFSQFRRYNYRGRLDTTESYCSEAVLQWIQLLHQFFPTAKKDQCWIITVSDIKAKPEPKIDDTDEEIDYNDENIIDLNWQLIYQQILSQLQYEKLLDSNCSIEELITAENLNEEIYYYQNIASNEKIQQWLKTQNSLPKITRIIELLPENSHLSKILEKRFLLVFKDQPDPMTAWEAIRVHLNKENLASIFYQAIKNMTPDTFISARSKDGLSVFEILLKEASNTLLQSFVDDLSCMPESEQRNLLLTNPNIHRYRTPLNDSICAQIIRLYIQHADNLPETFRESVTGDCLILFLEVKQSPSEKLDAFEAYVDLVLLLTIRHNEFSVFNALLLTWAWHHPPSPSAMLTIILDAIKTLTHKAQQQIFNHKFFNQINHRFFNELGFKAHELVSQCFRIMNDWPKEDEAILLDLFSQTNSCGKNLLYAIIESEQIPLLEQTIDLLIPLANKDQLTEIFLSSLSSLDQSKNLLTLNTFWSKKDYNYVRVSTTPQLIRFIASLPQPVNSDTAVIETILKENEGLEGLITDHYKTLASCAPKTLTKTLLECIKDLPYKPIISKIYTAIDESVRDVLYNDLKLDLFIWIKRQLNRLSDVGKLLEEQNSKQKPLNDKLILKIAELTPKEQCDVIKSAPTLLLNLSILHSPSIPVILKLIYALPDKDLIEQQFSAVKEHLSKPEQSIYGCKFIEYKVYLETLQYFNQLDLISQRLLQHLRTGHYQLDSFIDALHTLSPDVLAKLLTKTANDSSYNPLQVAAIHQPRQIAALVKLIISHCDEATKHTLYTSVLDQLEYTIFKNPSLTNNYCSLDLFIEAKHYLERFDDLGKQIVKHFELQSPQTFLLVDYLLSLPQDKQQATTSSYPILNFAMEQAGYYDRSQKLLSMVASWKNQQAASCALTQLLTQSAGKNPLNLIELTASSKPQLLLPLLQVINTFKGEHLPTDEMIRTSHGCLVTGLVSALKENSLLSGDLINTIRTIKSESNRKLVYTKLGEQLKLLQYIADVDVFIETQTIDANINLINRRLIDLIRARRSELTLHLLKFIPSLPEQSQIDILSLTDQVYQNTPILDAVIHLPAIIPDLFAITSNWSNEQLKSKVLLHTNKFRSNIIMLAATTELTPEIIDSDILVHFDDRSKIEQIRAKNYNGNNVIQIAARNNPELLPRLLQILSAFPDEKHLESCLRETVIDGLNLFMHMATHRKAPEVLPLLLTSLDSVNDSGLVQQLLTATNRQGNNLVTLLNKYQPALIPDVLEQVLKLPQAQKFKLIQPLHYENLSRNELLRTLRIAKRTTGNEKLIQRILKQQRKFTAQDWFTIVNEELVPTRYSKSKKELVLEHITRLQSDRLNTINKSLDRKSTLGNYFYTRRGFFACRESAGTLKQLVKLRRNITESRQP